MKAGNRKLKLKTMIKKRIEKLESQFDIEELKCAIVTHTEINFHIESLTDKNGISYLKDVQDFPSLRDLMNFYKINRKEIVLIELIK